jgi:hypothetical protein
MNKAENANLHSQGGLMITWNRHKLVILNYLSNKILHKICIEFAHKLKFMFIWQQLNSSLTKEGKKMMVLIL